MPDPVPMVHVATENTLCGPLVRLVFRAIFCRKDVKEGAHEGGCKARSAAKVPVHAAVASEGVEVR